MKRHEAAALINSKGLDEAIKEIAGPEGPFVWKDSYEFLMNMAGKMLAHPMQSEPTKLPHCLLITDSTEKALFVSFVNLAKTVGHGRVEYMWPRPGHKSPLKKIMYIYRARGRDLFVGARVYVGGMMYLFKSFCPLTITAYSKQSEIRVCALLIFPLGVTNVWRGFGIPIGFIVKIQEFLLTSKRSYSKH